MDGFHWMGPNDTGNYNVGSNISCNTIIGLSKQANSAIISVATYLNSNDISKGCLIAFLVTNPTV